MFGEDPENYQFGKPTCYRYAHQKRCIYCGLAKLCGQVFGRKPEEFPFGKKRDVLNKEY